ncbi:MAG: TIR domain-containing protein [Terracidiphilus sp.]
MLNKPSKPSVFVGSSSEGHKISQAVQVLLDSSCEAEIWSQGVFGLTQGTLESLMLALDRFDFAILVLTADDLLSSRGMERAVARDNVLFEAGLFIGALGRERTFLLYDRSNPPALPSDLAGVCAAQFELHTSGNLIASLGAACTRIQSAIEKNGLRESKRIQQLTDATKTLADSDSKMRQLIRLLARSRKVELDIISAQFGPMIAKDKLSEMKQDLHDLESILNDEG